jgi:N-acetylmuramoyl-L-alanine amidase
MRSRFRGLTAPDFFSLLTATACLASGVVAVAFRPSKESLLASSTPAPPSAPSMSPTAKPSPTPEALTSGPGVGLTLGATAVLASPDAASAVVSRIREGIPLPVSGRQGDFLSVVTPCETSGWVRARDVKLEQPSPPAKAGTGGDLSRATVVLDPGHGGRGGGATGPGGLQEKVVNVAVMEKLSARFARPRDVDWSTGAIKDGSRYGSPRVILTRIGDYDAGLGYRASIANTLRADAFLSLHNNADPDGPSDKPGTEVYYQFHSKASKRLAGLAYQEVFRTMSAFGGVPWVAERDAGAKYRLSRSGKDYYGLLRRSRVAAALVEASFISNAPEEALLRRDDVRRAMAEALYRALVRYFTTDDPGSGFVTPYPRSPGPSGRLPSTCTDPA